MKLDAAARARLVKNFAGDLNAVRDAKVKARIVGFVHKANEEYGTALAKAVNVPLAEAAKSVEVAAQ